MTSSAFSLEVDELGVFGHGLSRAENVLTFQDGTVIAGSDHPFVVRIDPSGEQRYIGHVPGGELSTMAVETDSALLVTSTADGGLYRIDLRDGRSSRVSIDAGGRTHGRANYAFCDGIGRTWVAVATRQESYPASEYEIRDDGHIVLIDADGEARVVADGLRWPNEVRLNADGRHAYVTESFGRRLVRYDVGVDGTLSNQVAVGPDPLGVDVVPDGFALDADGNAWIVSISTNALLVVSGDDDSIHTVFEDKNERAVDEFVKAFESGHFTTSHLRALAGERLNLITSLAFGGKDLCTAYMGSLRMSHLMTFESPVPGLPLPHWTKPTPETEGAELNVEGGQRR